MDELMEHRLGEEIHRQIQAAEGLVELRRTVGSLKSEQNGQDQDALLSPEERSQFVKTKRVYFNHFSSNFDVRNCHQSTCCRQYGRRHPILLHIERIPSHESCRGSVAVHKV
ncbi:unnamed protein product [Diatraea saccharalis]|uniref:Uncharacterized protein n=1 Tax=Diatraea saccharalis TaxID=40085 RepID=A0A9N9N2H6_9NEOP|nr:unnamed protein product [Diatraea saccharalis]